MPESDGPPDGLSTGELLVYWRERAGRAELALYDAQQASAAWPDSPALVYCAADSSLRIQVDEADLSYLPPRERALCAALVRLSLKRLEENTDA